MTATVPARTWAAAHRSLLTVLAIAIVLAAAATVAIALLASSSSSTSSGSSSVPAEDVDLTPTQEMCQLARVDGC